jgi:hypothetical protein
MGFRFRRSFNILPVISLNVGKRGVSTSIGVRGAHVTIGHGQVRETVGLPGTGISYTHVESSSHQPRAGQPPAEAPQEVQPAPVTEPLPSTGAPGDWLKMNSGLLWLLALMAFCYVVYRSINHPSAPSPSAQLAPMRMEPRTGIEQRYYNGLVAAFAADGASEQSVVRGINNLQIAISSSARGNEDLTDAFHELGLSATSLKEINPEVQLLAVAEALARVNNRADRARLGETVFGASYLSMEPALMKGAEGLDKAARGRAEQH